MMIPTVHTNGTSQEELTKQAMEAMRSARALETSLRLMMPNGRDYYPQGIGALPKAREEHEARIRQAVAIYDDLLLYALKIGEEI